METDMEVVDEGVDGCQGEPDGLFLEGVDAETLDDEGDDDDDDVEYGSDHVMSDDLKERIKVMLTIQATAHLSLDKINTGWEKKMRFIILEPCKTCGVANHVDIEGLPARRGFDICEECHNEKKFQRKVIYRIPIPIGARHGSTVVLPNKGHVYNEHIRGNLVITLLDEPHEHFLRVFDDALVCFQIDQDESIHGVTRMLTPPGYPESSMMVIQTAPGCQIKDNDVFVIEGLGLMDQDDFPPLGDDGEEREDYNRQKGDLYVLFFVRSQHSVDPVKLKKVSLHRTYRDGDDLSDTEIVTSSAYLSLNGSADSSHEMKQNGVRSPRKRRKNGEVDLSPKGTRLDSTEKPLWYNIPPPSRIPPEELVGANRVDDRYLCFLDRLVNHPGTIPLPFRDPVPVEIPMTELEPLWQRYNYSSWWDRVAYINMICPDYFIGDHGARRRRWEIANSLEGRSSCFCSSCSDDRPFFELDDDSVDSSAEAVKELLTGRIGGYPDFPKFTLECRLHRCRVKELVKRLKQYLTGPKAKGTS